MAVSLSTLQQVKTICIQRLDQLCDVELITDEDKQVTADPAAEDG